MILNHGANSITRGGDITSIEVGGKTYPVVKIGYQYWITENLDFAPDGITVGSNAWYYNNDKATWGWSGRKCGLYYNGAARDTIDTVVQALGKGWKVATKKDFISLLSLTGQTGTAANKLKAIDKDWYSGWNGTDDYGFNLMPTGDRENSFLYSGSRGFLGFTNNDFSCAFQSQAIVVGDHYYYVAFPVRLIKETPPDPVTIGDKTYETVRIGNQVWMAENLALETSIFYYPNNNSANKENYGLLYPYKILYDEVIPNLPTGWRLPHKSDFDSLKSMDSTPADWISPLNGGNGSLGLNLPFAGYRDYSGSYNDFNVVASVWTDTFRETVSGIDRMYSLLVNSSTINTSDYSAGSASQLVYTSAAVRLVKDVT